jgi:hypothetical protein
MPGSIPRACFISRADLLEIGEEVWTGTLPATDLLVASFAWGWARPATGLAVSATSAPPPAPTWSQHCSVPSRNQKGTAFARPRRRLRLPVWRRRPQELGRPGTAPWARLRGYGPAFFTKFLYFSTPGALILDNRMASAVYQLTGLPFLITDHGHSLPWTPYKVRGLPSLDAAGCPGKPVPLPALPASARNARGVWGIVFLLPWSDGCPGRVTRIAAAGVPGFVLDAVLVVQAVAFLRGWPFRNQPVDPG